MSQILDGVIKFQQEFCPAEPLSSEKIALLNAWRRIFFMCKLIGQDPNLYDGAGYGNMSQRIAPPNTPPNERSFIITGSQTGRLSQLNREHYVTISAYYPSQNKVIATGPIAPSSESMTHGAVYNADESVGFVFHAHSASIWQNAIALNLPSTKATVPYGTPEMAQEVTRLFAESDVAHRKIFVMGGHEDGVISFGKTPDEAGGVMLATLAQAMRLEQV